MKKGKFDSEICINSVDCERTLRQGAQGVRNVRKKAERDFELIDILSFCI